MVRHLRPHTEYMALGAVHIPEDQWYPEILGEMVQVSRAGGDLVKAIDVTVKALGFETFMYGCSATLRPSAESRVWAFTTLPIEWVREYEAKAYIEVDPRMQGLFKSALPVIWDQSERGKSSRLDRFLDDASRYGSRSGIALLVPDSAHNSCMVAFNTSTSILNPVRRQMMLRMQGDLLTFGIYFHELFMKPMMSKGIPPAAQGSPLTNRELETMRLLVRGMNYEQVAEVMGITVRTVQAHSDSIRTRLNAKTMQEAVFLAFRAGLLAELRG